MKPIVFINIFILSLLVSSCANHSHYKPYTPTKEDLVMMANQGDSKAEYDLGKKYYYGGFKVKKNYLEAYKWFKRSAIQGNKDAQYCLGEMYASGKGVSKSINHAMKWYEKAAKQGDKNAQYNLGMLYLEKKPTTNQDIIMSYAWLNEAKSNASMEASSMLFRLEKIMTTEALNKAQQINPLTY